MYANIKPLYRYIFMVTRELRNQPNTANKLRKSYAITYNPIKARDFHISLMANRYES